MAPIVNLLRTFFAALSLTVILATDAHAQSQVARVGVIPTGSAAKSAPFIDVFRQRLRELGYVEGRNIAVEIRYPGDHVEGYREAAVELVALKVDVIVAAGTGATRAARQQTSTIPIVMVGVADALLAGFVKTLSRPGGNAMALPAALPRSRRRPAGRRTAGPGRRVAVRHGRSAPRRRAPAARRRRSAAPRTPERRQRATRSRMQTFAQTCGDYDRRPLPPRQTNGRTPRCDRR